MLDRYTEWCLIEQLRSSELEARGLMEYLSAPWNKGVQGGQRKPVAIREGSFLSILATVRDLAKNAQETCREIQRPSRQGPKDIYRRRMPNIHASWSRSGIDLNKVISIQFNASECLNVPLVNMSHDVPKTFGRLMESLGRTLPTIREFGSSQSWPKKLDPDAAFLQSLDRLASLSMPLWLTIGNKLGR